ncbi:OsmC family protein [Agromyces laixinhei]|uniref:OsmC family protein n=1 Tax=Agromyces laixinhei TaxID=2585717 RepID=UPI00111662FD|nr:OsmC family protein [Agromyces laixinhei]
MTDQTTEHAHAVSERIGPGSVSVTRVAPRRYAGLNERGATVAIGGAEVDGEHFTPGELLKLALAGCVGLSTDRVAARRLGDEFAMTVWAHGRSDEESNRYTHIAEEVLIDLSALEDGDRAKLVEIMAKAIDRACTVGRSVEGAIDVDTEIDGTEVR